MAFAFSSALFRPGAKFLPARFMNICTIRMAEPIPPGETSFRAMVRATSSAGLVKVPGSGKVDSVFTLADHFRLRVLAGMGLPYANVKNDLSVSAKPSSRRRAWSLQPYLNHPTWVKRMAVAQPLFQFPQDARRVSCCRKFSGIEDPRRLFNAPLSEHRAIGSDRGRKLLGLLHQLLRRSSTGVMANKTVDLTLRMSVFRFESIVVRRLRAT